MSKKKLNFLYDMLFYAFFTLIPIIAYLIHQHHFDNVTLISFFTEFEILSSNPIYDALIQMFGTNGYLPLLADTSVVFYMFTYMAMVILLHLVIDFIVFIPRLAHKYLNYFYNKE